MATALLASLSACGDGGHASTGAGTLPASGVSTETPTTAAPTVPTVAAPISGTSDGDTAATTPTVPGDGAATTPASPGDDTASTQPATPVATDPVTPVTITPATPSTFGATTASGIITVDSGAGLVFKVKQSSGDITSIRHNGGPELQHWEKGSHIASASLRRRWRRRRRCVHGVRQP